MDYNVTFVGGPLDGQTKQGKINFENKSGAHLLEALELTIILEQVPYVYQFKEGTVTDVTFEYKP